jgi:uncharacterized protein (TIGR02996 family)
VTDHKGFLADVLAHPDLDWPRLVYADWLEEHGEGARAEFIRVQCEAHQLQHGPGKHADHPEAEKNCVLCARLTALRRRERELLESHRREWTNLVPGYVTDAWALDEPRPPYVYGARVQYRRGFVASITCTAADWLAHADAITAATPLEEVTLTNRPDLIPAVLYGSYSIAGRDTTVELPFADYRDVDNYRNAIILALLAAEWPAIKFTLPPIIEARRAIAAGIEARTPS